MKKLLLLLSLCGVVGLEAVRSYSAFQAMKDHNIASQPEKLDLSNLGITTLGTKKVSGQSIGFLYCCGAEFIDLSNNKITTLSQEDISWLTGSNVLELNLSGNRLTTTTIKMLQSYLQCYYNKYSYYPLQIIYTQKGKTLTIGSSSSSSVNQALSITTATFCSNLGFK